MQSSFGDLFGDFQAPKTDRDWDELEFRARDVFSPHAPIDEEDLFAGRQDIIDGFMETVFQRGQHSCLGKTLLRLWTRIRPSPALAGLTRKPKSLHVENLTKLENRFFGHDFCDNLHPA